MWNARPQTARQRSTSELASFDPVEFELMNDDETPNKRPLRSARWFRKDDLPGFVHRSTLAAAGWSRGDLMTRPVVGILNTWSDLNPCNLNLRALAEDVRTGILEAGGIPFEIPLMSLT
jgi:dihydroxy-acid dehydratase